MGFEVQRLERAANWGSTLLELIVVLGLFMLMISLGLEMYVQTMRGMEVQEAKFAQMLTAREALSAIKRDVRHAHRVLDRAEGFRQGPETLILQVPALRADGQPRPGVYDTIVYHRSPNNPLALARTVRAAKGSARRSGTRILAEDIARLNFAARPGETLVAVEIASRQTVHHRRSDLHLRATAALRNRGGEG